MRKLILALGLLLVSLSIADASWKPLTVSGVAVTDGSVAADSTFRTDWMPMYVCDQAALLGSWKGADSVDVVVYGSLDNGNTSYTLFTFTNVGGAALGIYLDDIFDADKMRLSSKGTATSLEPFINAQLMRLTFSTVGESSTADSLTLGIQCQQ